MAITDMKGTVSKEKMSLTGLVNKRPSAAEAPDLSSLKVNAPEPKVQEAKPVMEKPAPQNTPREEGLLQKVQNLTDEEKIVLSSVLSPSVSNALGKIAPELQPLLAEAGPNEENVLIPVSMFKSFATKRYSGDETQAVQNFMTDLTESPMDQNNVPPNTQMAEQPESGMEQEFNAIDTEGEVV